MICFGPNFVLPVGVPLIWTCYLLGGHPRLEFVLEGCSAGG